MTYIRLLHVDLDDDRWLTAGADAFAIHYAAMVWCDKRLTDGRIPRAMAERVSLAVPASRAPAAVDALIEHAFWAEEDDVCVIGDYLEHAFPAEQVKRTRARWNEDKARRRQHAVGDHSLCKDPKFCKAISTPTSTVESTGGRSHLDQTQLNQTKPDRRSGFGSGSRQARASAGATAAPASQGEENDPLAQLRQRAAEGDTRAADLLKQREEHGHAYVPDQSGLSCKGIWDDEGQLYTGCGLGERHVIHYGFDPCFNGCGRTAVEVVDGMPLCAVCVAEEAS